MSKRHARFTSFGIAILMMFMLTSCNTDNEYMDFLKYGWDGGAEPTEAAEENGEVLGEEAIVEEEATEEATEQAANGEGTSQAQGQGSGTASANNQQTGTNQPSKSSSSTTKKNSTAQRPQSGSTTKAQSGSTTKPQGGSAGTTAAQKKTYTSAEALELYKVAANKVKTTNGAKATRTKEVITTISGEIPSMYQTFGFKPGTNTEQKVCDTSSKLKKDFCVEGQTYVCNLSASDIKSATVSYSGSNTIVTIYVKDDTEGTYDHSSKAVSTISVPIGTWTCKGVVVKGTINSNGQLTALYYNMPTYVKSGSNNFAFSLEQYWTITY